ncbi:MAG: ethanolamine utilization protein EutQ [Pseudomonadota bacterium]
MTKAQPRVMKPGEMTFAPRFEYGEQAEVAVACGPDDGTALGCGYVRMTGAEIPWTIKYDEIVLVLEGSITIRTAAGDLTAKAHDSIWLPAGTKLTYVSPEALLFYAIHPANWAEAK